MNIKHTDEEAIKKTVELYFTGTYRGDAKQLAEAFHPEAHITGLINNDICDWTLSDFIARVTGGESAEKRNENYDKKILFEDHHGNIAMVKTRVAVGALIFTDYIMLLKINGKWIIRNKSFTNDN